jgi:uncharacterized repeat protein (TIGR03803 family)
VIYSPSNASTGLEFRSGLIQASDGLLYGTTVLGGSNDAGTIFRLNPDGTGYTVLQNLVRGPFTTTGANPLEPLLEASDGNLYGTTYCGGVSNKGVIFSISKDTANYTVLKNFGAPVADGDGPMSPLIEASDGLLYGSTYGGGSTNNGGTIFRIHKDGSGFEVILAFDAAGSDGRHPCGALVEWHNGSIYGTTERGGANNQGTLFRVNKDNGHYEVLASLGQTIGACPRGGLVQGPDGALYGATEQGGDMGFGTLFRYGPVFGDILDLQIINQIPILTAIGQPGTNYILEHSFQLGLPASWTPVLSTNAPPAGRFIIPDDLSPVGTTQQNFYMLRF